MACEPGGIPPGMPGGMPPAGMGCLTFGFPIRYRLWLALILTSDIGMLYPIL